MEWTRRQFGLWSSAALLVSHRAFAAEPQAPAQAVEPTAFDALVVEAALATNEERRLRVTLDVGNPTEEGQTFHYELVGAALVDAAGKETDIGAGVHVHGLLAYFEKRQPHARRRMEPTFVDVAPGKSTELEAVLVDLPEERPAAATLRLTVGLYHGLGPVVRKVVVELPWPGEPNA